ncbi:NHL repeat-containing protein [Hymenobacter elongatus]|uniref:SMP-30/Gluconolactonase/LRE-like region domain-containing protein n=1 Tax=Hymenobacter elongatus TaxID=877208 RepID=A0A4Z0PQS7_9BACT|nr:NHL repeat-containing protein [Hymenobacter elongatus]TGE18942.1 hypothetical protein E5J99_04155 [Hymenobacter elongatus]
MLSVPAPRLLIALSLLVVAGCKDNTPLPVPAPMPLAATHNVTILAGTTGFGYADGTGAAAAFDVPAGLAVDAQGNVYVADTNNQRIRKISPAGVVTTLAGSGPVGRDQGGYVDGPVAQAMFRQPSGVAVDAQGAVYVADFGNYRVRKISPAGIVTTVAPNTQFELPTSLVVDAQGTLYVGDAGNYCVYKISPTGAVSILAGSADHPGFADGPGTSARFLFISGLCLDAQNNVFVADPQNHRIRKISPAGVVTTVAGSGQPGSALGPAATAQFDQPTGVAVDAQGTLYVADEANNHIRQISPTGVVSRFAGTGQYGFADGPANTAHFIRPRGIISTAEGTLYVTQRVGSHIRVIRKN